MGSICNTHIAIVSEIADFMAPKWGYVFLRVHKSINWHAMDKYMTMKPLNHQAIVGKIYMDCIANVHSRVLEGQLEYNHNGVTLCRSEPGYV